MEAKFTFKKAVSLTLALSFLVMSYTGIMLFVTPKGKIAYWTDWTLLGLSKTQYTDLHVTSMFVLLVFGVWHIYYNWKPLTSYLKNSLHRITPLKKEFLFAFALNLFVVVGTLLHVTPMQSIVDLNSAIKNYWERQNGAPPFGHAEEATLAMLAPVSGTNAPAAMKRLRTEGIAVENAEQTLQQIADHNGITAQQVYDTIAPAQKSAATTPGSGMGRRTLSELSDSGQFDLDDTVNYLKVKGFDATPQSTMREAASALGTTPYTLFETLKQL